MLDILLRTLPMPVWAMIIISFLVGSGVALWVGIIEDKMKSKRKKK